MYPDRPVTIATVGTARTDAVILALRSGEPEEVAATRAVEQLRRVGARVAGVVLNALSQKQDQYYTYYSYRRNTSSPRERTGVIGRTLAKILPL